MDFGEIDSYVYNCADEAGENHVPLPQNGHHDTAFKVKVFVINEDGNWSDCGMGTIVKDLDSAIIVYQPKGDPRDRDFIEESRLRKLKGGDLQINYEDKGELILRATISEAIDFKRSQSKSARANCRYHHTLGAERYGRKYCN